MLSLTHSSTGMLPFRQPGNPLEPVASQTEDSGRLVTASEVNDCDASVGAHFGTVVGSDPQRVLTPGLVLSSASGGVPAKEAAGASHDRWVAAHGTSSTEGTSTGQTWIHYRSSGDCGPPGTPAALPDATADGDPHPAVWRMTDAEPTPSRIAWVGGGPDLPTLSAPARPTSARSLRPRVQVSPGTRRTRRRARRVDVPTGCQGEGEWVGEEGWHRHLLTMPADTARVFFDSLEGVSEQVWVQLMDLRQEISTRDPSMS